MAAPESARVEGRESAGSKPGAATASARRKAAEHSPRKTDTASMATERTFSILKPDATRRNLTGAVAAFESTLFLQGTNWTEVLLDAVLEDENLCLRTACLRTNTYILKYNPAVSSVYLYYNGNINELSSIISYFCNI